jgi:signal transduction histidine kinase
MSIMFRSLHIRLTLLYAISVLILVVLVGGSTYALLQYYFQINTDLALQYRMAKEFSMRGMPLPNELATADRIWARNQDRLLPSVFIPPGWRNGNKPPNAGNKGSSAETYDSELAAIFIIGINANGQATSNSASNSSPLSPDMDAILSAETKGYDWRTIHLTDGTAVRLLTYYVPTGGEITNLQAGRLLTDQQHILTQLLVGLLALGVVSAILIGAGSWWTAGRSLVPAQRAWEQQQVFIANASHELRTPLTLMHASTEVAMRDTVTHTERQELLSDVLEECNRMARLIDDLLLLSRLDARQLELKRETINLAELLEETRRQFNPLAQDGNINLEVGQAAGVACSDATRIRQVILILLDNAIRHTPSNGMIRLDAHAQGNQVVLTVSDTGIGITREHLPHIFERFYQADSSRSGENHGSGLGLSIAQALMQALGGKIIIESQYGHGTRVTLLLPQNNS